MYGLIDTHFHLDMYKNYEEIYDYLESEKQYTLCMTNSPGIYRSCKEIFRNNKYIQFAMGFHPLNTDLTTNDMEDFRFLLPSINYVGEVGLDFSRRHGIEKRKQILYFDEIVSLCSENNKLMSVHIRNAEKEALEIMSKYRPKKCILHWYTGLLKEQKEFIRLGCYFSINANMLNNMDIVNSIPKDRILIESDGPYSKVNGKKYVPQLLMKEYEVIARSMNEPDLIKVVHSNFKELLEK